MSQPRESVIFDKNGLLERVLDDEELVKELIQEFLEEMPGRLEELKAALEALDFKSIRSQGHTIKGTAGNMGAIALQKVAARLEAAGQGMDKETASQLTEQLEQQFQIFRKESQKQKLQ